MVQPGLRLPVPPKMGSWDSWNGTRGSTEQESLLSWEAQAGKAELGETVWSKPLPCLKQPWVQ